MDDIDSKGIQSYSELVYTLFLYVLYFVAVFRIVPASNVIVGQHSVSKPNLNGFFSNLQHFNVEITELLTVNVPDPSIEICAKSAIRP